MSETKINEREVVVYGSNECPYTKRVRAWLDGLNVNYRYVNVDTDAVAEALIASWNNERAIRPTLDVGGQILINPKREILETALRSHDLLP